MCVLLLLDVFDADDVTDYVTRDEEDADSPTEDNTLEGSLEKFVALGKELVSSKKDNPGLATEPDAKRQTPANRNVDAKDLKQQLMYGVEPIAGGLYKFLDIKAEQQVQGDSQDATATSSDQADKQLKKAARRTVVSGGTLVPTYPSFAWTGRETVSLNGLAKRCNGRYHVTKATLSYDNSKGLATQLELKTRVPGKKSQKKEDPKAVSTSKDAVNASRPVGSVGRRGVVVNGYDGAFGRFEVDYANESPEERSVVKDFATQIFIYAKVVTG